ncbi:hypothetical protein ABL78_2794 [Leptomonas seymouri]|uniref:Uncharacterized protein n=1 Tax=Leptomonas seymouri TaxID=5684 RepID=A0A0N0P7A8_LEPSE|nr:hypothetical protein ABL78_2794 [Leptomonas seymouri]|eukprot:KPI88107.1 hypothetical protein ABL78_2794 [Leptomonas seymouri]
MADGRSSAAPSSSGMAGTAIPFSEESSIVLDKWLMDVCGEEDLQFPSHRREQYPAYIDRLRRVSKAKQFVANTFDYPSRSGTREVLTLQSMLEALRVEEQALQRKINEVQENVTQVRRALDERTMGASSIVEEEKTHAAKLAALEAEKTKAASVTAAGAPPTQAQLAARRQDYAPLSESTPIVVASAPARPSTSATYANGTQATSTAVPRPTDTSLSMGEADDDVSTAGYSVPSPSAANTTENNNFSAVARSARRADYEKKKALSLRYIAEVQSRSQDTARQRAELDERLAWLLKEKEQLDKEYEALQTTETLVVVRHEEAEAHEREETALLQAEAAACAAEHQAFASVWKEAEAESAAAAPAAVGPKSAEEASATIAAAATSTSGTPLAEATAAGDDDQQREASLHCPPMGNVAADAATASPSLTPAEHDKSPPEAALSTHRPPSRGSNSVAPSVSSPTSHSPSPVERALLSRCNDEGEDTNGEGGAASKAEEASAAPAAAVAAASTTRRDHESRRVLLEGLRHRLSELGAAMQACRRQLLNTSQTHMSRFRQSQQRLKDWQDMAEQVRTTYQQLRGQVDVIRTVLHDTAARLDKDGSDSTYAKQLAKLNGLMTKRSYEAFQYYVGSADEAALEMMYDANAEEELLVLNRPSPSASAGGMTPLRGVGASAAPSVTPTRENSLSSAYQAPREARAASGSAGLAPSSSTGGTGIPHKHRSRYQLVRHLQRWEAALLADRLAILKAAGMVPGPFSGAGANTRKTEKINATRCYQELRHLLIQPKTANRPAA